jgi:hypothetical protein
LQRTSFQRHQRRLQVYQFAYLSHCLNEPTPSSMTV